MAKATPIITRNSAERPRLMPVESDSMEPTMQLGDYVAVVPADQFKRDGVYVLDVCGMPAVYRCGHSGDGNVIATLDNQRYQGWSLPMAAFEAKVLGYVVGTVKVTDRAALEWWH